LQEIRIALTNALDLVPQLRTGIDALGATQHLNEFLLKALSLGRWKIVVEENLAN
jgi:hypothetical protein